MRRQSEPDTALLLYQKALEISSENADQMGQARALSGMGAVHSRQGRYRRALDYHQRAFELTQSRGDARSRVVALNNLLMAYTDVGEYSTPTSSRATCRPSQVESGDRARRPSPCSTSAGVRRSEATPRAPGTPCGEPSTSRANSGDRSTEGVALLNLGVASASLGAHAEALELSHQALAISRQINDRLMEGRALTNVGVAYAQLGQYSTGLEFLEQALAIDELTGHAPLTIETKYGIAVIYVNQGREPRLLPF